MISGYVYDLDFTKVVDRSQLTDYNYGIYRNKQELFNNIVRDKNLMYTHAKLIRDMPYLYLRLFYGLEPRIYQDMFMSDRHPYKNFVGANQVVGKSWALSAMALYNFDQDWGYPHNEGVISASKEQAKYQMSRIKNWQKNSKFDVDKDKEEDNVFVIRKSVNDSDGGYKHSNMIMVAPHSIGSLGYDLHKLNNDEIDFWDTDTEYVFNQHLQPRTYETMKQNRAMICNYSNPNGYDSFLHKLTRQVYPSSGVKKWHTYSFSYWDSPGANQKDFDEKSVGLTRRQVESTLLGIFSTGERSYFSIDEIRDSYSADLDSRKHIALVGRQSFWFLDVGSTHDQSVLVGGYVQPKEDNPVLPEFFLTNIHIYPVSYPIARVVGSSTGIMDNDGWHYEKSVREYLEENSLKDDNGRVTLHPVFGCDVTGNSGISPLFQSLDIIPEDVVFSGPNKSGYYQRFKYLMEKRLFHRIKSVDWESQAKWLMAEKSNRGYLMIHNLNHFQKKGKMKGVKIEEDLDDCMDATAGWIHLCSPYTEIQPSLTTF